MSGFSFSAIATHWSRDRLSARAESGARIAIQMRARRVVVNFISCGGTGRGGSGAVDAPVSGGTAGTNSAAGGVAAGGAGGAAGQGGAGGSGGGTSAGGAGGGGGSTAAPPTLSVGGGTLKIEFCAPNVVHVVFAKSDSFI